MPPIPFADNYLAGSLLTLILPIALLIAIAIWYVIAVKKVPESRRTVAGATAPAASAGAPAAPDPQPAPGGNPPEAPPGDS
jgi:hypothetical protein